MIQSPNDTPTHTRRLESKALFMLGFNLIMFSIQTQTKPFLNCNVLPCFQHNDNNLSILSINRECCLQLFDANELNFTCILPSDIHIYLCLFKFNSTDISNGFKSKGIAPYLWSLVNFLFLLKFVHVWHFLVESSHVTQCLKTDEIISAFTVYGVGSLWQRTLCELNTFLWQVWR